MIDAASVATEAGWTQMTLHNSISEEIASLLEGGSVTCRQWTEQDLGPYYLDGQPVRRDITEGRRRAGPPPVPSTHVTPVSCGAVKRPTPLEWWSSVPSTRVGIQGGPSIST